MNAQLQRRGGAAFGLIGILVVLAIILFLFFGNFGGSGSYSDSIRDTRDTGRQMSIAIVADQLVKVITQYKLMNDATPTSYEDLDVSPSSFNDPWDRPVSFTCEKDPNTGRTTVTVTSAGVDGEFGTEDDLIEARDLPV